MNRFNSKKDILWITVVTLLLLAPLCLLVRRQPQQKTTGSGRSYSGYGVTLSPDGAYLASIEPPPENNAIRDLVVRHLKDEKEIVRMPLSGDATTHLEWAGAQNTLAATGGNVQLFKWTSTPRTGTHNWTSNGQTFTRPIKELQAAGGSFGGGKFRSNSEFSFDTDLFIQRDSKGRFSATQVSTQLMLSLAADVGKSATYTGSGWDSCFGIRPLSATSAPPAPIQVVVMQKEPTPTPTPLPSPTPLPTAKPLTPRQQAFLDKEKRENAEIEKLVERVMGVDGTPPPPLSAAQEREIEAEVKRRNLALSAEKKRLFPPTPTPTPLPRTYGWASVELWDLVAGKRLWKRRIQVGLKVPRPLWSKDGTRLALLGVPIIPEPHPQERRREGISLLNPATGQEMVLIKIKSSFDDEDIRFLPTTNDFELFVANDSQEWEFFDARTGLISRRWKFDSEKRRKAAISTYVWATDRNGLQWVFLSFRDGDAHWKRFSRAQMEDRFGA